MTLIDGFAVDRDGLDGIDELARLADEAADKGDSSEFYTPLRSTDVPYLLTHHRDDPARLFDATVAAVHEIGSGSPAIALAVSQHMSSMWTFGTAHTLVNGGDQVAATVSAFLDEVYERRLLIANTTSQAGGSVIGASASTISEREGSHVVEGWSTFMSMATEADKITFITRTREGHPVAVLTDLAGNPGLRVSDALLFGDHLALADTRRVHFDRAVVPSSALVGPDPRLGLFYVVNLICQNLSVAALYLGGARRILDETRRFGHATTLASGSTVAESSSFAADIGRLVIAYGTSVHLIRSAAPMLAGLHAATSIDPDAANDVLLRVTAIKHEVARNIEEITVNCRKLIGARAFMGDHPVSRIGAEVVFAALGPATEKNIERNVGARFLEDHS